jgi:large subunit ribosomal protein L17
MKKRIAFRKLGRTTSHKWSMLRNQVSSLIEHERIVTTEAKAKELRHLADHVVTLAKRGDLHNRRRAASIVRGDWNVSKLFDVLGPRYQWREGGYCRVLKLARPRVGDNAPMAVIEYVDRPGEIRAARPPSVFQNKIVKRDGTTTSSENTMTTTTTTATETMNALEDALRQMGIPPVDDLLTSEEQEELEKELRKSES